MRAKLLHITFIVMLVSGSVVLLSFFQCMHYKCSQATCNEQLTHELHLLREKRLQATLVKSKLLMSYQLQAFYLRAKLLKIIGLMNSTFQKKIAPYLVMQQALSLTPDYQV